MPVGFHIASAWVDIRAEDKGLRSQVKGIIDKATAGQALKIPIKIDSKGLRNELTRAMKEATSGQGVAIPVKVDSKGLRNELNRAIRAATTGQGITIPLKVDSRGLRNEINRAVREASSGNGASVNLHVNSTGLRSEINRAIASATAGQGATISNVHFRTAGLREELSRAIRVASAGQHVNVPVRIDRNQIAGATNTLRGFDRQVSSSGGGMKRWKIIFKAAFAVGPTVGLLSQNILGVSAGLLSMTAAAGGAAAIFGGALAGGLRSVNGGFANAVDQAKQANNALKVAKKGTLEYTVAQQQAAIAQANLHQAAAQFTPVALRTQSSILKMKDAWSNFIVATQPYTLTPAMTVIKALTTAIPKLTGVVRAVAPVANEVANAFQHWVNVKMDGWMSFFTTRGVPILRNFITIGKNVGTTIGILIKTFGGFGQSISQSLAVASAKMRAFAENGGFDRFLARVKENAPIVKQFLTQLITLLSHTGQALTGLGPATTVGLTLLIRLLNLLPIWALQSLYVTYGLVKIATLASAAATLVFSTQMTILRGRTIAATVAMVAQKIASLAVAAATRVWAAAQWLLNAALYANPVTLIIVGIVALIAAIVLIATKTTWFQTVWKYTWNAVKAAFSATVGGIVIGAKAIGAALKVAIGWIGKLTGKTVRIAQIGASAVWSAVKTAISWIGKLAGKTVKIAQRGASAVWSAVKTAIAWIGRFVGKTVHLGVSGVQAAIGWVKSLVGWIGKLVSKTIKITANIGGSAASLIKKGVKGIGHLLGFAHGGMVHRAMGGPIGFASGGASGAVAGPGSATSDSIAAMLSNGEYVIKATSVKRYGAGMLDAINKGAYPYLTHPSDSPRYATGGLVGAPAAGSGASAHTPAGGGASGASGGAKAAPAGGLPQPAPIVFTAIDATSQAVAAATAHIMSVAGAQKAAQLAMQTDAVAFSTQYTTTWNAIGLGVRTAWTGANTSMRTATQTSNTTLTALTNTFGNAQRASYTSLTKGNTTTWGNMGKDLKASSVTAYNSITASTNKMSTDMGHKLQSTRSGSHTIWDSFKTGMIARNNATYASMSSATSKFGSQTTVKFGQIKNSVGNAWDGVRPKLAAPIKYLINKVINSGVVPAMNTVVNKLGGSGNLGKISAAGFATGGYVSGPGSGTSDSIPARLSNGEFVLRQSAVQKFGVGYLNAMNSGRTATTTNRAGGGVVGLAGGGLAMVTGASKDKLTKMLGTYSTKDYENLADWIWENAIQPLLDEAPGGSAMKKVVSAGGNLMKKQSAGYLEAMIPNPNAGGNIDGAIKFADAQIGKPYVWAGAGPDGYDCSGFMSSIQKVIDGKSPYGRMWSTFDFQGSSAPTGWKKGLDAPFKIGVTNNGVGHTAGTLGGTNYEATPPRLRKGPSARGYNNGMFQNWYGYEPSMGGIGGYKPGAGVAQWTEVTKTALKAANQSLSLSNTVLHQMQTESGGNPRAVNLTDSNAAAGYPSVGLMQVIRPTFRAYAGKYVSNQPQAYGVSEDPLANIYSAIKYVLAQYGSVSAGMQGHAYAAGGPVTGPGSTRSDSVMARLSNGEFVMQATAVQKYGTGFMSMLNKGKLGGFASGGSVGSSTYTVRAGDTLSELAVKFNTTVQDLVDLNHIQNKNLIKIGQVLTISSQNTGMYLIKQGDTLTAIAKKFNTTVDELVRLNNIKDANKINAGTTIHVPGGTGTGGGAPGTPAGPPAGYAYVAGVGNVPIPTLSKYYGWAEIGKDHLSQSPTQPMIDARKSLIGDTVVGPYGSMAGITTTQIANMLGKPTSQNDIIDAMYALSGQIKAAGFTPGSEKWLMDKLNASGGILMAQESALEGVTADLQTASSALDDLNGKFASLKDSIASSIVSFGSITKIGKWGTSVSVLTGQLQSDVASAQAFSAQLAALKTKGLDPALIQQIAEAGITGGGAATAATILSATPDQIAQINLLQKQLNDAANAAGTTTAAAMYQAGIDAAQGLVDGLTSQQAQIQQLMMTIAQGMELAIKQSLGIASPSKVMYNLAKWVPIGLAGGINDHLYHVANAVANMCAIPASAVVAPPGVGSVAGANGTGSGTMSGSGHTFNIKVSVDGTFDLTKPGQRREIAKTLVAEIKEEIRLSDKARARP